MQSTWKMKSETKWIGGGGGHLTFGLTGKTAFLSLGRKKLIFSKPCESLFIPYLNIAKSDIYVHLILVFSF